MVRERRYGRLFVTLLFVAGGGKWKETKARKGNRFPNQKKGAVKGPKERPRKKKSVHREKVGINKRVKTHQTVVNGETYYERQAAELSGVVDKKRYKKTYYLP